MYFLSLVINQEKPIPMPEISKNHSLCLVLVMMLIFQAAYAQEQGLIPEHKWSHSLDTYFFIKPDDFFVLPMYQGNKDWLHLEARYNYEDRNTVSGWFGYNFYGGERFQYLITPMMGGILGKTDGIAPGLEITFTFYGFMFYSENEYVFDMQGIDGNYFYTWDDFTYSPVDWLWFGVSTQETKPYDRNMDWQYGLVAGGGYRWFGLSGYAYNFADDDRYFIIDFSITIPE
jgi:hypothetical protein